MKLSQEARAILKRPLGTLFAHKVAAIEHVRQLKPARLITVGDIVTYDFLKSGFKPGVAVVDFRVMRAPALEEVKKIINAHDVQVVRVKNPAGTLTSELISALQTAKPLTKIIVDGEEDLATLPAVLMAPVGSVVVYGQPNEGIVLIEVTEQKKREVQNLLTMFEEV